MIEVKESIYKNLNLNKYDEFVPKWGTKPAIFIGQLIDALFEFDTGPKAIAFLGRSEQTFNRRIKQLFPNVALKGGGQTWKYWLIEQSDYTWCSYCKKYKLDTEFGNYSRCRSCNRFHSANSRLNIDRATPKWADLNHIQEIYDKCPEGYHVDHYYPINSPLVCGLHVKNNLQYLTALDNLSKSNNMPD